MNVKNFIKKKVDFCNKEGDWEIRHPLLKSNLTDFMSILVFTLKSLDADEWTL